MLWHCIIVLDALCQFVQLAAMDSRTAGSLEEARDLLKVVEKAPDSAFSLETQSGKLLQSSNPDREHFPTPDQAVWATGILASMLSKQGLGFADLSAASDVPTTIVGHFSCFCIFVIADLDCFSKSKRKFLLPH